MVSIYTAYSHINFLSTSDLPTPLIPVAGGGRTSPVPAQNTQQPLPTSNQILNIFS